MSWFESSTNQTAAGRGVVGGAIAVDLDFTSGHFRASTWNGSLTIGGNSFFGAGSFASISGLKESALLVAERKTYRLNLNNSLLATIPESDLNTCRNRTVLEYLCFIDPDTGQLIDTPELTFEGQISFPRRVRGPQCYVEIVCESRLVMLDKADGWRWTAAHQEEFFSGDTGFNQVHQNELRDIFWGGYPVRPGDTGGGGSGPKRGQRQPV